MNLYNKMLNNNIQKNIINDLLTFLKKEKVDFLKLNKKCTQDTDYWILKDYKFVKLYLKNYTENNKKIFTKRLKPKGKIFIILSYNEPLVLSIIPTLNAIVAGNNVILKPSKKAFDIVKKIWIKSGIVDKYNLNLKIIQKLDCGDIEQIIKSVVAVYFFGGMETGSKIAKKCANNFVEFIPEIETSDFMIVNYDQNKKINKKLIKSVLHQSFSHTGQSCQRIHGVYVQQNNYKFFLDILKKEFINLINSKKINKYITNDYKLNQNYYDSLLMDIKNAAPKEIVCKNNIPIFVIKPRTKSIFINKAYFLPTLWLVSFQSQTELNSLIELRKFSLGMNIMSDKKNFIDNIIQSTNFSRYTINTTHINIRDNEGWGGMCPSGFFGYKSWLHHFSNAYTCIEI